MSVSGVEKKSRCLWRVSEIALWSATIGDGKFENIIWDAAIEHFTETETQQLMGTIGSRLTDDGILSGYTIVEAHEDGHKHLHQQEYEFNNKEDLARFFAPHFKNLHVLERTFPNRTNLSFYASNGALAVDRDVTLVVKR